jgi:hypothetical protein
LAREAVAIARANGDAAIIVRVLNLARTVEVSEALT